MYGKDEYHDTRAREILASEDRETVDALRQILLDQFRRTEVERDLRDSQANQQDLMAMKLRTLTGAFRDGLFP